MKTSPSTRLLSKFADADEVPGVSGAQNRSVHEVLEDSSTGTTKQFAATVEFRKKSLQRTLRASRNRLGMQYSALSEELNLTMRLRHSIQRKPWWWLGGALTTGIITSFWRGPRRSQTKPSPRTIMPIEEKPSSAIGPISSVTSLFLGETSLVLAAAQLVRILFPVIRPVITEYVTRKINAKQIEFYDAILTIHSARMSQQSRHEMRWIL